MAKAKSRTNQKASRPTLDAVARLAEVSPATVSRALNKPSVVAEETYLRIRAAIDKTGYVPNLVAGALASSRSRLVAVIVPALARSIFNEMIEAVCEELVAERYQVMLALSGYQDEHLSDVISAVLSRRPEGVILTGSVTDPELREKLTSTGAIVIETRHLPRDPIDYVVGFSHSKIGEALADLMYSTGRRAPLIVMPDTARSHERQIGFSKAMAARGVRRVSTITLPMPASFGQGRAALAEFLDSGGKADCVVCGSDWQAHGVLVEAKARGISIPGDLAVVGFGNMDFADSTEPSLTSVHIDGRELGAAAARILLDRAAGRTHKPKVRDLGFTIVRRDSA